MHADPHNARSKILAGHLRTNGTLSGLAVSDHTFRDSLENLLNILDSRDYSSFLRHSPSFLDQRPRQLEDTRFGGLLLATIEMVGEYGSFSDSDQRPLELRRRLNTLRRLLATEMPREQDRASPSRDKVSVDAPSLEVELDYFREVGPDRTPKGWCVKPAAEHTARLTGAIWRELSAYHETFVLLKDDLIVADRLRYDLQQQLARWYYQIAGESMVEFDTRGAGPFAELKAVLQECYALLANFSNKPERLGDLLAGSSPALREFSSPHPQIAVRTFAHSTWHQLRELERITSQLVINKEPRMPQEGFLGGIHLQELDEMHSLPSSRRINLSIERHSCGDFVVNTKLGDAPAAYETTLQAVTKARLNFRRTCGWGSTVGIKKDGRIYCKAHGLNGYDLVLAAVRDAMYLEGVHRIFGEVRLGDQANLALEKHQKRGWCESNLIIQHGSVPYRVIYLDV